MSLNLDSAYHFSAKHTLYARACMCAYVFKGVTCLELCEYLGVCRVHLSKYVLAPLVASGCMSRSIENRQTVYRTTKAGRKLVREDQARVRTESLAVLQRMLSNPRCKVDRVEPLLAALKSDSL